MQTKIIKPADNAHDFPLLIKSLLSGMRFQPDNEIVYSDVIRYDYRTLYKRICKLANVLTEAGVKAGDTVAVMDWDSHRYLESYFAVPMIGAVLHHVNIRLSVDQIGYTMGHAEDNLVLLHDDFTVIAEQLADQLPSVRGYIRLSDDQLPSPTNLNTVGEYETLLAAASDEYDFPDFDENSIATLFYTTGTTGNPKGVYFSHRQLVLHTLNGASTLGSFDGQPLLRSDDVYMPMTPMFHVHAWGVPYIATMLGVKQVYSGRYDPNKLLRLYREEGVTFSHGVPTVLQMILNCDETEATDMSGWKLLTGGSAATPALAQQMVDQGILLFTAYGMSETCPLVSAIFLKPSERELELSDQIPLRIKAGVPIGLVDLKIVDPEGNDVAHDGDAVGEIVVRSPWLTQGYYKEEAKGEELWENGWLHTGDVASIDKDYVIQIKDRIKDVIKTGGEWISSLELENLISQYPAVSEVAVVGVPDEKWGERPYALVVPMAGEELDSAAIQQHLQQYVESGHINKWAVPRDIKVVADIPKTSVGKINKKVIRTQV
ncbi:fatty acid--CoA ligase [Amphritea sp. 2_MG-2023]|jgi:fatty-acyl-CoA synthase|uniref:fatty acid--CoA ligase n=1 Tax=Amphritea TaxID=515417 RepID=UPI001C0739FF|nr:MULTISPECIES: fatty acid--CoA ligase [Amphritea]MBU2966733.1 fatty acid--CoA ligase [Amphritea atlantica]MDO6417408.1 fatty acid--CoA ligase [Amphritea sp. 2_MG-2023]